MTTETKVADHLLAALIELVACKDAAGPASNDAGVQHRLDVFDPLGYRWTDAWATARSAIAEKS